jgi:hypothetical protein
LHQPEAATKEKLYRLSRDVIAHWKSGNTYMLTSEQAAIGRFVSKPGRKFGFAVRFVNLRKHELGALLFALGPTFDDVQIIHDALPEFHLTPLVAWLNKVTTKHWNVGPAPLLAHKLGHGRPLGLGSVEIKVDMARTVIEHNGMPNLVPRNDLPTLRTNAIQALVDHLVTHSTDIARWVESVLIPWLQVHRYAGRRSFDYPRTRNLPIFEYHTGLRGDHAKGRKLRPDATRHRVGLEDLDQLDI